MFGICSSAEDVLVVVEDEYWNDRGFATGRRGLDYLWRLDWDALKRRQERRRKYKRYDPANPKYLFALFLVVLTGF